MDRIRIEGIEFHGHHGVPAAEREIGHRFRVDVELELDLQPAAAADDFLLTVDYARAAAIVLEVGTGPPVQLVETLAERTASRLFEEFPRLDAVELRVAKLQPPCPVPFHSASVHIRRSRGCDRVDPNS